MANETLQTTVKMILGLPHLSSGVLLERARTLGAPVLISANCLSRWTNRDGERYWNGFNVRALQKAAGMELHLDSAGFVAMHRYRGFPWSVEDYIDLAASFPFARFSSMDLCVEPEVAANDQEVLERIAKTVQLNYRCERLARDKGIAEAFMPVIQGHHVDQYLYCIEEMGALLEDYPVIGVGSMCRRKLRGPDGILSVVSALDQALPSGITLHLFGLKSAGAEAVRSHPRISSVDSQSYGVIARQKALKEGVSKTNHLVASVMGDWYDRQQSRLQQPGFSFQGALSLNAPSPSPGSAFEEAAASAAEHIRQLVLEGEIDADQILDHWYPAWAADDLDDAA